MIIIIGSLALCLSCVGKILPPPFQSYKNFNNPSIAVINSMRSDVSDPNTVDTKYDSCTYAIVDGNSKTLNILTKDWTLFTQNTITGTSFTVDKIVSCALYEKSIYLSVISWSNDKNRIEKEFIIKTNIYGEFEETLYESENKTNTNFKYKEYLEETYNKTPKIHDIKVYNCNLTFSEYEYDKVCVKKFPLNNTSNTAYEVETVSTYNAENYVIGANYLPNDNTLLIWDLENNIYYCTDNNSKKIAVSNGYTTNINKYNKDDILVIHYGDNPVQIISKNNLKNVDDSVNIINHTGQTSLNWGEVFLDGYGNVIVVGNKVPIGWFYNLKINARWLAICILSLALILCIVFLIKSQLKLFRKGLFKEVTVALLIGATAISVCVTYSIFLYNSAIQTAKSQVNQQVNIAYNNLNEEIKNSFSDMLNYYYYNSINNKTNTSTNNIKTYQYMESINSISSSIINEYSKNNNVYLYSYYAKDDLSGRFLCIADSEKACQNSLDSDSIIRIDGENKTISQLLFDNKDKLKFGQTIDFENNDSQGLSFCSTKAIINDNNEICGTIMFYTYADTTIQLVMQDIWMIAFIVLICYLLFMVAYLEIKRMSISIKNYCNEHKKLHKKNTSIKAFINLIRPINFAIAIAFGADSALAVLVSKKLYNSSDIANNLTPLGLQDFMYGLPITITCIGLVVGILTFTYLQKKFYIKSIFIVSSCLYSTSFILSMISCINNIYILFVFAKLFIGFFCGCMKAELYTFTTLKNNEKERKTLLRDISRSTMPAVVVSTLLCGYLTAYVDYYVLYLFAAICSITVIILGLRFVPTNIKLCNDDAKSSLVKNIKFYSQSKIIKWIFSPQVLLVVFFVIIPCAITKGYKSYMFPLYSNSIGLDKTTISIIFSLATMVSFLLVHVISDFNNRFKDSRKVINGLCVLGFVFVLFRANSRIEWAIVAMFLTTIFGRTFGSAFRLGLTRICENDGLGKTQIQPYIYLIEEICNALQVILCGLLTTIWGKYACPIFGIYCLFCAVVFAISVKRTAFDLKTD